MDWKDESVLEFIKLMQKEPSIWNHRNKNHRNRTLVKDAWVRIKNAFSLPCTIEDLKRKRNTLLTQYRDRVRRIKKSQQTASDVSEYYKPTWFAFDALNNYLKDLYDAPVSGTVKHEEFVVLYDEDQSNESNLYNESHPSCEQDSGINPNIKRRVSWESNSKIETDARRFSHETTPPSEPDSFVSKKRRGIQEPVARQASQVFIPNEKFEENPRAVKECDLFGQLIAEKLKCLGEDDRLQLMNDIDNLVFNHFIGIRRRKASQNNSSISSDLPGPSTQTP